MYRRAILRATESLNDFRNRSNIDSIRRLTKAAFTESEKPANWSDCLFLQALKSVVDRGEVELCANIQIELSHSYKRKRVESLKKRREMESFSLINSRPALDLPLVAPHHVVFDFNQTKELPYRPREHEKWKIIPKKVYDHIL